MRFEGHVVLVTGAAKGIGLRIARAFAREGARVAALDIDAPGADALARELVAEGREALALKADVTAAPEVRQAVDAVLGRWGRIDVLVNNAGGFSVIRRTEDIPDDEWEAIFRFNVTSAFLCAKAVLPQMKRQRSGAIVNLSSVAGRAGAVTVTSHYAAAKAALLGFTRHLAREVAREASGLTRWRRARSPPSGAGGISSLAVKGTSTTSRPQNSPTLVAEARSMTAGLKWSGGTGR